MRESIAKSLAEGTYIRLPHDPRYRHNASLLGITDGVALVWDCALDDAQKVSSATGEVVNQDVATQEISAKLTQVDAGWHVLSVTISNEKPGEVPCLE